MEIHPLKNQHQTDHFTCGDSDLDNWLRRIAKQHLRKGISRTFVALPDPESTEILGFYSLTVGEAEASDLPRNLSRSLPRKIPMAMLGRLAVASEAQGQGLGGMLLVDALRRIVRVAAQVGIALILVDAKHEKAAAFYRHFGFQPLPDTPLRLAMSVATAADLGLGD